MSETSGIFFNVNYNCHYLSFVSGADTLYYVMRQPNFDILRMFTKTLSINSVGN